MKEVKTKYNELIKYFESFNANLTIYTAYKKPSREKQAIFEKITSRYEYEDKAVKTIGTYIRSFNTSIFTTTTLCYNYKLAKFMLFVHTPTQRHFYTFLYDEIVDFYNEEFEKSTIFYDFAIEDRNSKMATAESLRILALNTMMATVFNCKNHTP